MIKLNLGCGDDKREGYVNIDLYNANADLQCDVAGLPYNDNTVDEIFSSHVIEHFDWRAGWEVLREWYRVLKPGGVLKIETPDFHWSCAAFVNGTHQQRIRLYSHFFSEPWKPGHTHKFLFTEEQLGWQMSEVGFKDIKRMPPDSSYSKDENALPSSLYLNLWGFK